MLLWMNFGFEIVKQEIKSGIILRKSPFNFKITENNKFVSIN
jgi:hypothetical protein